MPPMTDAPTFSAAELIRATAGVPLGGGADWSCHGISTDTRTLESGNLFVALAGERFDGHDCLNDAVREGGRGPDRPVGTASGKRRIQGPPAIGVPDTDRGPGGHRPGLARTIPVPWSRSRGARKDTTKEMLTAIASSPGRSSCRQHGKLNNQIGLPLTLFGLRRSTKTGP
jgi:UDP-N-acetylmuramoyl-tripeptide--D-alanyl-D-alanine ligase